MQLCQERRGWMDRLRFRRRHHYSGGIRRNANGNPSLLCRRMLHLEQLLLEGVELLLVLH
jgi:hypothetical protein